MNAKAKRESPASIATAEVSMTKYPVSHALTVINGDSRYALVGGDTSQVLDVLPDGSIDCVITSPPYWNLREYSVSTQTDSTAIGLEGTFPEYLDKLKAVFAKVHRVLKDSGSLWLNLGDKYENKRLLGMPWRVAIALQDDGWILRNEVIWNQCKGSVSGKDRLRMNRESIFHFVKQPKYYYDWRSILIPPEKQPSYKDGQVMSATGVSGKKYRQQIETSLDLNPNERREALRTLDEALDELRSGQIVDFRMTIKGQQRVLHGDSSRLSGRAKELEQRGFYILKSLAAGYLPGDIWTIVPEDEWRTDSHCAVFPIDLLEIPIKATCPKDGVVLDPFVGTGSAVVAGLQFGRRAIGIDISEEYLDTAYQRIAKTLVRFSDDAAPNVRYKAVKGNVLFGGATS